MLRDGTVEIKGDTAHFDLDCRDLLQDAETNFELEAMTKPDYFAPYQFVEGLVSSREFAKKGMPVACLANKRIYPEYGVYMPTHQEYLNLLQNYLQQQKISDSSHLVDLGCGSGILSIIAKESGDFKGKYTLIDSY